MEYIVEILSLFNRGARDLTLRALGRNITKGIEIAWILSSEFQNIKIDSITHFPIEINGIKTSSLKITLVCDGTPQIDELASYFTENKDSDFSFIESPIYHLLFDTFLSKERTLEISTGKNFLEDIDKEVMIKGSLEIPLIKVSLGEKAAIKCKNVMEEEKTKGKASLS